MFSKLMIVIQLIGVSALTCGELKHVYKTSPINDGTFCCDSQPQNVVQTYGRTCQSLKNMYGDNKCCSRTVDDEIKGIERKCGTTNRICQTRSSSA